MTATPKRDLRDDLLHALDFNYVTGVLGYGTPEELLAAYDTSQAPADRAAVLREAIDVAREEGHRLEEEVGIEAARGARCVAYLLRKRLAKERPPRRMADETATTETRTDSTTLLQLVRDFLDPDPCSFDHHGYCQAHAAGLGGEPLSCPHGRARKLLAALEQPAAGARQDGSGGQPDVRT